MACASQRYEHSFFNNPSSDVQRKQSVFIDLGDEDGDSLLRGIAAGLLDKILKKQKVAVPVVEKIMKLYLVRFPEDRRISTKVSATERLQQLVQHTRLGKLTQRVAYILGQMIAKEFSENEEYSRLVFNGELTSTAITHDEGWGAITALSSALPELPLEFQIVEADKPLFKRVSFNTTTKQNPDSVVMQLQDGYCRPRLASSVFTSVVLLPVSKLSRVVEDSNLASFSDVNTAAPTELELVVSTFEEVYRPLCAMVVAGELSADDLRDIYAQNATQRSVSASQQRFRPNIFDGVVSAQSGNASSSQGQMQFAKYLAYSISKAVSLGEMDKTAIFNLVDAVQATGVSAQR